MYWAINTDFRVATDYVEKYLPVKRAIDDPG